MTGSEAGHGAMVSFSFMFLRLLWRDDIVPVQFIIDEMNRKNHPSQNDRGLLRILTGFYRTGQYEPKHKPKPQELTQSQ